MADDRDVPPVWCPRCGSARVYTGEVVLTCLRCRLRFWPGASERNRRSLWATGILLTSGVVVVALWLMLVAQ
jgi:hypothetical protein